MTLYSLANIYPVLVIIISHTMEHCMTISFVGIPIIISHTMEHCMTISFVGIPIIILPPLLQQIGASIT